MKNTLLFAAIFAAAGIGIGASAERLSDQYARRQERLRVDALHQRLHGTGS